MLSVKSKRTGSAAAGDVLPPQPGFEFSDNIEVYVTSVVTFEA